MSLTDLIGATIILVRGAYKVSVMIRDAERFPAQVREMTRVLSNDLNIVGGILDQLRNLAHRVNVNDENFLLQTISSLKPTIDNATNVLNDVQRDRNFFQRLFLNQNNYRKKLSDCSRYLHSTCLIIQGTIPALNRIAINRREFSDFRRQFRHVPDKKLSCYDFSIIKDTPQTIATILIEAFDTTKFPIYMKLCNEQVFFSYQVRMWSALNPRSIVLTERLKRFRQKWSDRTDAENHGSNSSLDSITGTRPPGNMPTAPPPRSLPATTNKINEKLDFSEFFMSHDDICGMALTKSFIYVATKYEITTVSLEKQERIALNGREGNEPNTFNDISYIYIPSHDETNLYIVDRGQYSVHQYKIDDTGLCFEYVRRYVVIADVSQKCNLLSCVIYKKNLFVSDDANNCLHVFPLNGDRQSFCVVDNAMTPFSPGALCAHFNHLYVANQSAESPSILVFNEECEIVDWFRNQSLKEILAIDIDPYINELYILTTTNDGQNTKKQRPLIVSMDLVSNSQQ